MERVGDMSIDVISSLKSGRFLFSTDEEYAGALIAVTRRPIMNDPASQIMLLRVEFEVFLVDDIQRRLLPTGGVASRDLVVTPKAPADKELRKLAEVLSVRRPDDLKSWYKLDWYTTGKVQRWVRIRFGDPDEADLRQPFVGFSAFNPIAEGYAKAESSTEGAVRDLYWSPSKVAVLLRKNGKPVADDTVIRFVGRHKQFGDRLVRMEGKQRRINWYLCWHLWEAERYCK